MPPRASNLTTRYGPTVTPGAKTESFEQVPGGKDERRGLEKPDSWIAGGGQCRGFSDEVGLLRSQLRVQTLTFAGVCRKPRIEPRRQRVPLFGLQDGAPHGSQFGASGANLLRKGYSRSVDSSR